MTAPGSSLNLYRPNVAIILRNAAGKILICERADWPGCWQFPQGGVKSKESPDQALVREVQEELGLPASAYKIIASKGPYRYAFPEGVKKGGWSGQAQTYYLADLTGEDPELNFGGPTPEFRDARWILPREFPMEGIPAMKHQVYRQVFEDFFNFHLP
jgi:putative (di)nucleoside polyphosphate hydrolase